MDNTNPIVFYDIASGPPVTSYAPNPRKTRYALNFKRVHYRTHWVELPDVPRVRGELQLEANRRHPDGGAFPTLPIIVDPRPASAACPPFSTESPIPNTGDATKTVIGDSFDIAVYLDTAYRQGPSLIPDGTLGLLLGWNAWVDSVCVVGVGCCNLPFDPATADISKAEFGRRFGKPWAELGPQSPEERRQILGAFEAALGPLAKAYQKDNYVRPAGPFLQGDDVTYADFIVGGWLQMYKKCCPEWDEIREWHGGLWRRLFNALEKYAEVK